MYQSTVMKMITIKDKIECTKLTVNNEMFRLDFNHGHDLVQIEKLNGRGTAFLEVHVFKLGRQFGAL
jgi:hypothetical protein